MQNAATQAAEAPETSTKPVKKVRSTLVSRNVTVCGHRTSVRLEPAMWNGLTEICRRERATAHAVCTAIAEQKPTETSLTAALRVFIMAYYRAAATEEGHAQCGHGQKPNTDSVERLVQTVLDPSKTGPLPLAYMIGKAYTPPVQPTPSALPARPLYR